MTELAGRCTCGAVSFRATPARHEDGRIHVDACHCGICRRQVGGPLMGVMLDGPPVVEDQGALAVYQSSEWAERSFCRTCGANLFWRLRDGSVHMAHAGAFDAIPDARFADEVFIDEKSGYYDFAGDRNRMTGADVMAMFASKEA